MRNERGDVVFAPDPFKPSDNPRPWLILSADPMPFPGEFLCAALTHSEYPANYEVQDEHWVKGGLPPDEGAYCSPWLLATIKSGQIRFRQGRLTEGFTDEMTQDALDYLDDI